MPGKGDKMTVWDDKGKHKLRKYYLTMYLKEACVLYLESCKNEDDKCFLSNFVISTKDCASSRSRRNNANATYMRIYFSS